MRNRIRQWLVSHPKVLGTLAGALLLIAQFGSAAADLMVPPKMLPFIGP